jgi:hypothetical protein
MDVKFCASQWGNTNTACLRTRCSGEYSKKIVWTEGLWFVLLPNIIRVIKSRSVRLVGHVTYRAIHDLWTSLHDFLGFCDHNSSYSINMYLLFRSYGVMGVVSVLYMPSCELCFTRQYVTLKQLVGDIINLVAYHLHCKLCCYLTCPTS